MPNAYTGGAGGAATLNVVKNNQGTRDPLQGPTLQDSGIGVTEVLKRLGRYIAPHTLLLLLTLLCTGLSVVGQLLTPIMIGHAIDACIAAGRVDFVVLQTLCAQLLVVVSISSLAGWLGGYGTNRLSYQVVYGLRQDCYARFEHMPLSFVDTHSKGDLLSRVINDVDMIGEGLLQGTTQLFQGVFTIVGTICFMFSIAWPPAAVVVAMTPLSILVAWLIAKNSTRSFTASQQLTGEVAGYAEEVFTNQQLISAFGREAATQKGFSTLNHQLNEVGVRAQFISSLSNPSTRLVNNIVYASVAIVGCIGVITGFPVAITAGQVQSFLSYANQYMRPFNDVSATVTQIQTALASARRVFSLIDAPQEQEVPTSRAQTLSQPVQGDIRFEHVDFGYRADKPLFKDLNFHIDPGQTFALVGPTGCGKTTLINLLLRFYDPVAGSILVDGIPTTEISRSELRKNFGMVLQDTWLFSGTIRDNIAYGRPDASDEEVREAARSAHAEGFINQLPQGYDTLIGEDGSQLSAGQCQLLCIARVMLANPSILLLDEATSSIDTRTEAQVQQAFDEMMAGRTSLVVAHRLSTIKNADTILVLGEGTILEQGSHEELLAKGGAYQKLYNSQFASTESEVA